MADIVDEANDKVAAENGRAIHAVSHQLKGAGQGYCIDCDKPIPEARRTALPSAKRCIDCQEAVEAKVVRR